MVSFVVVTAAFVDVRVTFTGSRRAASWADVVLATEIALLAVVVALFADVFASVALVLALLAVVLALFADVFASVALVLAVFARVMALFAVVLADCA